MTEVDLLKGAAEARKLAAEAQKAELDLLVPTLPKELPAETLTTPDKASPVGVVAAYKSLDRIAFKINDEIPQDATALWIVPDDRAGRYRAIHELLEAQLNRAETAVANARARIAPDTGQPQIGPSFVAGVVAALSFIGSALPAVMSLLETNTTVRSQDVTLTFTAVATCVARPLLIRQPRPSIAIAGVTSSPAGALTGRVHTLEEALDALTTAVVEYRAAHVDEPSPGLAAAAEVLTARKTVLDVKAKQEAPPADLEPFIEQIRAASIEVATQRADLSRRTGVANVVEELIETVNRLLALATTADASGATPLTIAEEYAAHTSAHVLQLQPTFAAAESVYEQVKLKKDRALHMGSAVVTYALTDEVGSLVTCGVATGVRAAKTNLGSVAVTWE